MSIDDKKPWERPWTTQEMIDNASNWNLAGDAGLLKYLEEFSDKMLSKVKDTNERLNDLIDSAEETSLALNNATNRFMGLRNTQFIESRVYEDDETLPVKSLEKECEKAKPTEAERLEEMKQAIVKGLDIIDKYYEKVEIPESDSEDDSSEANIVYKPVDPYSDRPLPYVIGTAEWHKYWHVGLGHSSSDSEIENEEEQFSESESEQDVKVLPIREQTQISDSESEDYSKNKMSRPVANSTFNDQTTKNMFDSSSDSETGSLPPQVNTVNSNFAEELAAKLGKVESSNIEVEVNTKPIKKPSTSNIPGGLFSDEPPPLDNDDIFVTKNISSDLFSGGNGLFDDDDDDFWNTKPKPSATLAKPLADPIKKPVESKDLFAEDNDQDDIFNNKSNISETKSEKPVKKTLGLFDDDDDDDDSNDIFNTSSIRQIKKPTSILNEEPPELEPSKVLKQSDVTKKPVGGVSVLGPNVLLDSKIFQKRAVSSSDSDNDSDKNESNESVKSDQVEVKSEPPKKLPSLFDDSSPLFTDDIFSNSSIKKFSSKLFEPEDKPNAQEDKSDLFRNEPPPLLEKAEPKMKSSIFDEDQENDDFDDGLFSNKNKSDKVADIGVMGSSKKSKSLSLFDDNNSDDDLFASIANKKGHSLFDPNPPELKHENNNGSKRVNLFDPNPPELDESDAKSESQFSDDPASYGSMNAGRASLYDTEPPMLSNESSGIARDQSTRLESEDSSFYPYLTSSRHHSDIFQDTQTADSLLTTRNKISFAADSTEKSNLSGIPEVDSMTKIDITASGNESSLISNDDSSVFQANISAETTEKPSVAQKPTAFDQKPHEEKPSLSLFDDEDSPIRIAEENASLFDDPIAKPNIPKKPNVLNVENIMKTSEKRKNKSVFGDSDSDDDLFSNKSSGSKNSSTSDIMNTSTINKKKNTFEDTKNKENDDKKFNYEQNLKSDEDIKIDPKKSLSFEKNIETEKSVVATKEEPDGEVQISGTSPGKLKHNLNINLQALLPGASPPKRNLEKSVSLDSSESQNQSSTEEAPVKPTIKSAEIKPTLEKSVSFESPVEHNEILPSAVKERAKIPVKRRPSTRRARQEAIRKSAADLKLEDAIFENADTQNKSENMLNNININNNNLAETKAQNIKTLETVEQIKNPLLNPLSPSTDEEDFPAITMAKEKDDVADSFTENSLFGKAPIMSPVDVSSSKDLTQTKRVENKDALKMPPKNLDLFGTDTDLFSSIEPRKPSSNDITKGNTSIFSSSDSENDLFSTPKSELKKPVNNNNVLSSPDDDLFKPTSKASYDDLFQNDDIFSKRRPQAKALVTKKSLFDDDDDDDDIFGGTSSSLPKSTAPLSSTVKKPTISKLKKIPVDPVENILDPLEALKK